MSEQARPKAKYTFLEGLGPYINVVLGDEIYL